MRALHRVIKRSFAAEECCNAVSRQAQAHTPAEAATAWRARCAAVAAARSAAEAPSPSHAADRRTWQQRRRLSGSAGGGSGGGDGGDGGGSGGGAASRAPTLKAALRALFLRVHPDLFSDYPAEQAENQRSFQLLQEYLEAARAPPDGGPASRVPYRFRFFLRPAGGGGDGPEPDAGPEAGAGAPAAEAERAGAPALVRAELTLPPPEPSPAGGGALSAATRKALGKLLGLCGIEADTAAAESEEDAAARRRLRAFLPEAAEAVRHAESGAVGWEVRAANIRGAMRLARRVVVGFGAGDFPGPRQVELLQALARVLDELAAEGVDVGGANIMFGSKTAMDAKGTLWLDAWEDDHESWADFLGGADLSFAAARREAAAALRRLEGGVAAAAGLGMVFAPAGLAATGEYRAFLERLAAHAAQHGPISARSSSGGGDSSSSSSTGSAEAQQQQQHQQQQGPEGFGQLPLYVAPLPPPASSGSGSSTTGSRGGAAGGSEEAGGSSGFEVQQGMCCLQVPVTAEPAAVYAFVQDRGPDALRLLSDRRAAAARAEDLAARVRARLRLRRLLRDPLLAPWQFEAGCGRLLQHAGALTQFVEGASVRVSDANRVDGATIDVAWDAEP